MNKIITRRVAAGVGVTGAALMAITGMGTGNALAGAVPNTTITKRLVDGTPVTVQLFGQNVNYQNSIVESFNLVREVWVSGKVRVTVGGEAEGGTIAAGYIIGCQVNVGVGAGASGGVENTTAPSENGGLSSTTTPSAGAETSLELGPGQTEYVPIVNTTDSDDDGVTDYTFSGSSGGVAYSQEYFKFSNCGGFAEGKAKVTVTVDTDAVKGVVNLYGKPFSLG